VNSLTIHAVVHPALAPTGTLGPFGIGVVLAGRYEIVALLGEGGMGAVYRAFDRELDEDVALKVLKPELAAAHDALARFRREVKLARRVTHVNVARTYDLGSHDGFRFLTMELITGVSLAVAAQQAIPLAEALRIAQEACLGLGEAHAAGVVHRDLKPENVMLAERRVVVTDFGIARALGGADAGATMGNIMGTPAYMAPEQVEGKPVDGRSDVYALGVMLYELVTGSLPFHGDTAFSLAAARLVTKAPDPRALTPQLPDGVAALIGATLARNREDRPDAATVAHELDGLRGARAGASPRHSSLTADLPRFAMTRTAVLRPFDCEATSDPLARDLERALLDALASCKEVTVAHARTSPGAAGELVIDGQLRVSGTRVRVRIRLVDGVKGTTLWAESITGSIDDPFALEDALTALVVPAVTQRTARLQGPSDPTRRQRFDEARRLLTRIAPTELRQGIAAAEAMHAEVPDDPWVLAILGLGLMRLWYSTGSVDAKLVARAEELALRAIDLEPTAADGYSAIGSIRLGMCDYRAALRAMQEALRHNPRLAEAHYLIGTVLGEIGSFDECLRRLELALRLDPSYVIMRGGHSLMLALLGKKTEALQTLEEARALGGAAQLVPAETRLVVWWHEPERAAALVERMSSVKTGGAWEQAIPFMRAYAEGKPFEGVDRALAALAGPEVAPRRRGVMYEIFAEYYADQGDETRAFRYLDEAMKLPFIDIAWLDLCPALAAIRPSPRFAEIRAKTAARITQLF
jgi:tetratricopeptide (TPR) repeat protein